MSSPRIPDSEGTLERYLEHWQDEVDSAAQYRALADSEPEERMAQVFRSLAKVEEDHIVFWESQLVKMGRQPGPRRPSWRSRVLIFLARRLGPQIVLPTIAANERVGRNAYAIQPETAKTGMASDERWHARILQQTLAVQPRGVEGSFLGRIEGRHRVLGGNALRASVLGANDGLCSNLSLVMGVAGANVDSHNILLVGMAGLLAGAFSMALGEWVSVTSSRELAQREIRIESDELEADPIGEGHELKLIYQAKGLSESDAERMVSQLLTDRSAALDALAREELGIDPADLGGSAWEAAGFSFVLFAVGAILPVLPFFFMNGLSAITASVIISGAGLFGVGAVITLFTGRSVWASGMRQLLLGLLAAGITFGIGKLIGATVA